VIVKSTGKANMDMELGSAELKESKPEVVFNNGKMVEIETSKANMKGNKP